MLCQYANCHESENLPVRLSVDSGEQRLRFCSEMHAAGWLLWRCANLEQNLNRKMAAMGCSEILEPMKDGVW